MVIALRDRPGQEGNAEVSFDWHMNKQGLAVFAALDQSIRVIICTKLNLY